MAVNIQNADFDFARNAADDDKRAFRGMPRRTLLPASTRLYRFLSLPDPRGSGFRGNGLFERPWWVPAETYRSITQLAHRTGSNVVDAARSRLAVTQEWNPAMEKLAVIELQQPVFGWVGRTAHQPAREGDRSVLLLGDFEQVYVPNLADDARGLSSRFAMLIFHGTPE
jgi:hypothetical protein